MDLTGAKNGGKTDRESQGNRRQWQRKMQKVNAEME